MRQTEAAAVALDESEVELTVSIDSLMPRLILSLAAICGAAAAATVSIPASSPLVLFEGRTIDGGNGSRTFDWVGVSARVAVGNNFTFLSATITDNCAGGNKFVVRMRAEGLPAVDVAAFYTRAGTAEYTLFGDKGRANFEGAVAEFTLIKAVEARFTQCDQVGGAGLAIESFSADDAFLPPAPRARRFELLGDSITAGDLLYCADSAAGAHYSTGNTLWSDSHAASYGSRICAAFDASCTTIAWGGMGLIQNDVPVWTWPTIPVVYESAMAWDVSVRGEGQPLSFPWDFAAAPPPDAVFIGLGTNDAAGNFNNASFAARFVAEYVRFATQIKATYAAANGGAGPEFFLINATCMTAVYAPSVAAAAATLKAAGARVAVLDLSLPNGTHCACGHPSADQHLEMAQIAIPAVKAATGWV